MNRHFSGRARGFTLVEIVVVIAIIGILGAIAIPAYNNYTTKAKFSEVVLSTGSTKTAIELCYQLSNCADQGIALGSVSSSGSTSTLVVAQTSAAFEAWDTVAQSEVSSSTSSAAAVQFASEASTFGLVMYECTSVPYIAVGEDVDGAGANRCDDDMAGSGGDTDPGAAIQYLVATGQIVPVTAFQSALAALTGQAGSGNTLPCIGSSAPCTPPTKYVLSESADSTGTITATAQSSSGLAGETFVLIPEVSGGRVDWSRSGTCKTRAGGALC
ncbi:type IV pilus assembly protein PilA [Paraburkholderia fungorum]|uniref:prepilin-type N-terminal cleavage/methylation domain-containing protein n=1 Tax=Paraburkholderia fungorum TaxID=134537 RepID=UPI000D07B5F3|nr:prepilin-type N-terminal cleavage/methylation domain-containing protein [Paraburkholderia fungorum]PRZ56488.1 type IV pilus assembly protein PilA [Paraburkholderia fungorum]